MQANCYTVQSHFFLRSKFVYLTTATRSTQSKSAHSSVLKIISESLTSVTKQFDNVLGIAEVRGAQSLVQEAEDKFMKSRRGVQETRSNLVRLQNELRELRAKLDRTAREDERYLELATEEHKALIKERTAKRNLETLETAERDHFSALSAALRSAHEKERSRAERTKYWSIIGSACGAVLGIFGSTVINMHRMKQIKLAVTENTETSLTRTLQELKTIVELNELRKVSTGNDAEHAQSLSNLLLQVTENTKLLADIRSNVEELRKNDFLVRGSELEQQKQESSPDSLRHISKMEINSSFVEVSAKNSNISTWWSRASLLAAVTASTYLMLCVFYK